MLKWCRAYSVNRFTGPADMFIFRQSATMRTRLYTSKSVTSKHLSFATFIFCSLPCSSQGQQPHFHDWKFPSILERIRSTSHCCCNQPPEKRNAEKKGKQIRYMEKRKQTENGKTPGCQQLVMKSICGSLLMRQERHQWSSYVTGWTTFKLEGIKDHERSTLHEHCTKIALAKKGPSQTDGARLEKSLTQQWREKVMLPNGECPC